MIELLKSKIHRATVTDSNLNYEGSITIGKQLMNEAGIHEYEKVVVVDINNGQRFETYAIQGEENTICLNGAAARLVCIGDKVIIMTYQLIDGDMYIREKCFENYSPKIIHVDETNAICNK